MKVYALPVSWCLILLLDELITFCFMSDTACSLKRFFVVVTSEQ